MNQIDPRIVKINIEVNGQIKTYTNLAVSAHGVKFANALQNECEVAIYNLDKQAQDFILTETSPFNLNSTPKTITVEAGRQSYGTFKVYVGNVISSSLGQPADVKITLKCLTGNFQKGNILAKGQPSNVTLSTICKQIAQDLKVSLTFQATDKILSNYSFTGAALKQINNIAFSGGVNVFIDNDVMVVKNMGVPLVNSEVVVNSSTGMVGIPELTEQGVRVKYLLDNKTRLGGLMKLTSQLNPSVNGEYVIYKLGFDIANREVPFYWIAEGARRQ